MTWTQLIRLAGKIIEISEIGLRIQRGKGNFGYERKADNSPVTIADLRIESGIKKVLHTIDSNTPILAEESSGEITFDLGEAAQTGLFSVDPCDGTRLFSAGLPGWSTSVVRFEGGKAKFAIVAQPGFGRCVVALQGRGIRIQGKPRGPWRVFSRPAYPQAMMGLDLPRRLADDKVHWEMAHRLIREYGFPRNVPSVASGVELLLGNTFAWFTASIAKHWDPAAGSLFVEEIGGVARCLDGSPVPWDQIEMPALLFAESQKKWDEVRKVMG